MKIKLTLLLPILSASMFILNACSTTHFVENWSDPEYKGPALSKILVIGIINTEEKRRMFEGQFTKLLTTQNRAGIASYTLIPHLDKSVNKEAVLSAVEKSGADGVLIVTTHGVSQQDRVTRGSVEYIPNMGRNYGMYGYYNMSNSFVYTQGNTVTGSVLRIDSKLFEVSSEKVIWSGKTKSFNPESADEVIEELERLIVRNMQSNGVIK